MCQTWKSEEPLVVHCSHLVTNRRLRLFGNIARSSPHEDHHLALAACIRQVPPDWKQPAGSPSHTWLCALEADLGPLNFVLASREDKVQRAKVCLNCTKPSVASSSCLSLPVGRYLSDTRCKGSMVVLALEVNCEQYGRRATDVY